MSMRRRVRIVLGLWALTSACGSDPAEPVNGALELTIRTTGQDFDPDGYTVTVDAGSPVAVPVNGTVSIPNLDPGVHAVALAGLAGNCALTTPAPLEITVPGPAGAVATVEITCTALTGALELTLSTTGRHLDPNGYTVTIDEGTPNAVAANGTVTVTGVSPGAHALSLADLDENCAVQEHMPLPFSLTAGVQTKITLHVTCTFANTLAYIQDDTVYITSAEPGAVPRRIGQGYEILRWSPDGSTLALIDYSAVYLADADGGNVRLLTKREYDRVIEAVWSPDGSWLLIETKTIRQNHSVLRLSTSGAVEPWAEFANEPLECAPTQYTWSPSWSPDGRHILVHGNGGMICMRNAEGGFERALARGNEATWSPDGSRIAFSHAEYDDEHQTTAYSIRTVTPDGTDARDLTPASSDVPRESRPRWSPDSQELSFMVATTSGTDSTTRDLWVMDSAGGNRRKLAPLGWPWGQGQIPPEADQVAWSRDGARLAFRLPSGQLAMIQRDGTGLTPVSPVGAQVTSWGWRP